MMLSRRGRFWISALLRTYLEQGEHPKRAIASEMTMARYATPSAQATGSARTGRHTPTLCRARWSAGPRRLCRAALPRWRRLGGGRIPRRGSVLRPLRLPDHLTSDHRVEDDVLGRTAQILGTAGTAPSPGALLR